MTTDMKQWLSDHGLTATQIADALGWKHWRMWGILSGRLPAPQELRGLFCGVYGMTASEYENLIKKEEIMMPTLAQSRPPCKNCKIRYDGCHEQCADYLAYRKVHEAEKKWQREQTIADSFTINSIECIKRSARRKKGGVRR